MGDFRIDSEAASSAISSLVSAATQMTTGNKPRPTAGFESLTGIAGDVDLYLRGLSVARAALADAAVTAGRSVRAVMDQASTLDAELGAALDADFAVRR
ncbi:hypothetical protein [Leucobacter sp. GX24907]